MASLVDGLTRLPLMRPQRPTIAEEGLFIAVATLERGAPAMATSVRVIEQRRRYAGRPQAYIHDILGYRLTPQQEEALELCEREDRVLLPSGNNVGKTFLLGAYGCYRMDAVAALPDLDRSLDEQGCQLLLPGPDHSTILSTIYATILEHAARAEARGFPMPGHRSDHSVRWFVRPRWQVEAFSPRIEAGADIAHQASGRHHRNQVALIEEGQGVEESVWLAVEGMCSGAGNKVLSSFNPSEPHGPAYTRSKSGAYRTLHLSAFRHPNIVSRTNSMPDAVSFAVVDRRVEQDCQDRGAVAAGVTPDETQGDFVYAMPPAGAADGTGRSDRIPGHPAGELRIYRPNAAFTAQVLGRWPTASDSGLFNPAAWDAAVARGRARPTPTTPADTVGLDVAREGKDDSCEAPRWGEDAETLLRAYADAVAQGPDAVATLKKDRRAYVGPLRILRKGDGPAIAEQVVEHYPSSPFNVDETGTGYSVVDHMLRVMHRQAFGVSFAAAAPTPTPGEPWSENMRTALYVRAALLVAFGLLDVPDDPRLREEVLAHWLLHRARVVEEQTSVGVEQRRRVPTVLLIDKDRIKEKLGRSPDKADAFVLAVNGPGLRPVKLEIF